MADYVDSATGARGLQTMAPMRDGGSNNDKIALHICHLFRPRRQRRISQMTPTPASRRIFNLNEGSAVNSL